MDSRRVQPRSRASLAVLLGLIGSLLPAAAATTSAMWTTTAFAADLTQHTQIYVEDLPIQVQDATNPGYLDLWIQTKADGSAPVGLQLVAISGESLQIGTYRDVRPIFDTPNHVRLSIVGQSIGCVAPSSVVRIDELAWTGPALTKLSLSILCPDPIAPMSVEVRINAFEPIRMHGISADQLVFPRTLAGTAAPTQTIQFTSLGNAALHPTSLVVSGTDASDFTVPSETCSGATLETGAACEVVIRFAPIDGPTFDRTATLTISDDTPTGLRTVILNGYVRRPTTITLTATNNPATLRTSLPSIMPTVAPDGAGGRINYYVNGVFVHFTLFAPGLPPEPLDGTPLGTSSVTAQYVGSTLFAPSTSAPLIETTRAGTSILIRTDPSPVGGSRAYNVSAMVSSGVPGPFPPGGILAIWDDTTGSKLAQAVTDDQPYLVAYSQSLAGTHALRATYSGVAPNYLPSTGYLTFEGLPPTVPEAPWWVIAVGGDRDATVTWQPPLGTGGSPVTGYVATASPGGQSCTVINTTCVVSGLSNGTSYTFSVTASNIIGVGPASPPSNAVVPDDTTAPSGWVAIEGGAVWTKTTDVTVAVAATDAGSGVSQVQLSNDGTTWTTRPYSATQSWTLSSGDGLKTVWVEWVDGVGNWSAAAPDMIILDTVAPSGGVSIAGGASSVGTPDVIVDVTATDATSGLSEIELSNDGSTWTRRPYASPQSWTLSPGDGAKTVWARWADKAGNWSIAASDTILLDTTVPVTTVPDTVAPVATAPTKTLVVGSSLTSGRPTVRFAWSGSDAGSGIGHYEFALSTDGGAYATVASSLAGATFDRAFATGHTYRAAVRATDLAGNVGPWAYGLAFRLTAYQEGSSAIHWSGTWRTGSSASFWGGHDRYASAAGAKASLTFTARSFAWVGSVGPSRGWAKVYVNGVLVRSVNLNAVANANGRILFSTSWSTARSRTITIRISGTAGHPRGDVDAFLTGS